jgi:large subunit ribosomal protein L17
MRHHNTNRKFGREQGQRKALLRSLARELILHEKIQTTEARAKEIRSIVEKLITRAKTSSLATRRALVSTLGSKDLAPVTKLLDTLAPRFKDRAGGYTRITKVGNRESDAAPEAIIEFI